MPSVWAHPPGEKVNFGLNQFPLLAAAVCLAWGHESLQRIDRTAGIGGLATSGEFLLMLISPAGEFARDCLPDFVPTLKRNTKRKSDFPLNIMFLTSSFTFSIDKLCSSEE